MTPLIKLEVPSASLRLVTAKVGIDLEHSKALLHEHRIEKLLVVDDAGNLQVEEFDMVVLSVGLQVPQSTVELAERIGEEIRAGADGIVVGHGGFYHY